MHCPTGHAGEDHSIVSNEAAASLHLKRAKIVNAHICEWWEVRLKSFFWQIHHLLFTQLSPVMSANDTGREDLSSSSVCTGDPILLTKSGKQVISSTMS